MQSRKIAPILALLTLTVLAFIPIVAATTNIDPLTPSLGWSPNPNSSPGTSETGMTNVALDTTYCPSGDTYSGTLTVTPPSGPASSLVVPPTACGTPDVWTYGGASSNFIPAGTTTVCGIYVGDFAGATTAVVAGSHPSFDLKVDFAVEGCSVNTAPEFGAPVLAVAAMGLLVLAATKRGRLLKL